VSSRSIASAASAVFVAFILLLCPRLAGAEKRVVVLEFEGPKAAAFQKTVIAIVKADHEYLSSKRFVRAAKKTKGFKADEAGVAKVARKLKAHGVLLGQVSKKGKRYKLTLKLREGNSGELAGDDITVTVVGTKVSGAALKKLKRNLLAAIDELPELEDERRVAREEPASEEIEEEEPTKVAAADEEGDADAEEPVKAEAEVSMSAGDQADLMARGRAIDVVAGLAFVSRNLTFVSDPNADQPSGYQGGLVPGVYLAADLYPMALTGRSRGVLQNLGLSFELERILLINSKIQGTDTNLPTTQQRFGVGALYRWNLGRSPTSPTVKLGVAYNKASFTIDKSDTGGRVVTIPNVDYTYLSPGVELRYPINETIALGAEAHYLFVTALGEMQQANFYGAASITAFDVELGGEYRLTSSLLARAGFRFNRFSMAFDGSGQLANPDGGAQEVSSATDQYLGLYTMVGYLF
jgi:hypothetical protein